MEFLSRFFYEIQSRSFKGSQGYVRSLAHWRTKGSHGNSGTFKEAAGDFKESLEASGY